jgi:hypothetical protein
MVEFVGQAEISGESHSTFTICSPSCAAALNVAQAVERVRDSSSGVRAQNRKILFGVLAAGIVTAGGLLYPPL